LLPSYEETMCLAVSYKETKCLLVTSHGDNVSPHLSGSCRISRRLYYKETKYHIIVSHGDIVFPCLIWGDRMSCHLLYRDKESPCLLHRNRVSPCLLHIDKVSPWLPMCVNFYSVGEFGSAWESQIAHAHLNHFDEAMALSVTTQHIGREKQNIIIAPVEMVYQILLVPSCITWYYLPSGAYSTPSRILNAWYNRYGKVISLLHNFFQHTFIV